MKFRKLRPEEIDLRVGTVTSKGVSFLLYKNARVDMAILDETVGTENWQREHYECKGNLFCRVGIRTGHIDAKGMIVESEWVWKADCGTESATEKEKGESSDSFKRACVCWGIGRELYTAPFIWIPLSENFFEANQVRPKLTRQAQATLNRFRVSEIGYNDKDEISKLVIVDKDGTVVWQK